jgi:hypothetical protein
VIRSHASHKVIQCDQGLAGGANMGACVRVRLRIYRDLCKERWHRIFPGWIKKMQYAYRYRGHGTPHDLVPHTKGRPNEPNVRLL